MTVQLHVLGPAFGLPSIDAECTAAIALLSLRYRSASSNWTITIAHTDLESLPRLVDGEQHITGFSNICHHLRTSNKTFPSADGIALTSLIQSRAPALLSAYLYVSYENFSTTTRPAFTQILPLYARFIIPGALRSAAKARTAQLGISSLDVEAIDSENTAGNQRSSASENAFETTTPDRPSLVLPKAKTVRSLLAQKPEKMAAFQLKNLADALLEPLQAMLGHSEFLSGKGDPGAVDCLAYAYLSLMLSPPVPQPWLRTIIQEHYPLLEQYTQRLRETLNLVTPQSIQLLPVTLPGIAASFVTNLHDQIAVSNGDAVVRHESMQASYWSQHLASIALLVGSALVAGASWAVYPILATAKGDAVQIFGQAQSRTLSHVSAALSGLDFFNEPTTGYGQDSHPHITNDEALPARVGIEVEP